MSSGIFSWWQTRSYNIGSLGGKREMPWQDARRSVPWAECRWSGSIGRSGGLGVVGVFQRLSQLITFPGIGARTHPLYLPGSHGKRRQQHHSDRPRLRLPEMLDRPHQYPCPRRQSGPSLTREEPPDSAAYTNARERESRLRRLARVGKTAVGSDTCGSSGLLCLACLGSNNTCGRGRDMWGVETGSRCVGIDTWAYKESYTRAGKGGIGEGDWRGGEACPWSLVHGMVLGGGSSPTSRAGIVSRDGRNPRGWCGWGKLIRDGIWKGADRARRGRYSMV